LTPRLGVEYSIAMRSLLPLALVCLPATAGAVPWSDLPALEGEAARLEASPPAGVPRGSIYSVQYVLEIAEQIRGSFADNAQRYLDTAASELEALRAGRDPFATARGFVVRGFPSELSETRQGYSVYVPPTYDPSRPTPLLVVLHGGSSNHSLFLAVVFGNDVEWATYHMHWWDLYRPQWESNFLVLAPDGMGQVMWRWMGERDVLDAIDDVKRHYNVDPDRVYLNGLSNGGVGCYSIGMRHAWRFASVLAMAGAPSWLQYHRGSVRPWERTLMEQWSALNMLDNARNTRLSFFHGLQDHGPMSPEFPRIFDKALTGRGIAHSFKEFDCGHDVLYWVHRRGKIYGELAPIRRDPHPREVWIETRDYRANRQHWLEIARFVDYPKLARAHAQVTGGSRVVIETENADRLALHLADMPLSVPGQATLVVDGDQTVVAQSAGSTRPLALVRRDGRWRLDDGRPEPGLRKVPGLSGPITDALMDRTIYVYGTKIADQVDDMRRSAEVASRGWPLWSHAYHARVMPEDEVTADLMRRAHIVVFGTPQNSALIARASPLLPIHSEPGAIVLRDRRLTGTEVGMRMVYPNPLADGLRYLIVQTGNSVAAVQAGNRLPDFVPDYVVYDGRTIRERPRLVFGHDGPIEAGFFDSTWRLPAAAPAGN
jgi:enterochelin esterase-like enzyme